MLRLSLLTEKDILLNIKPADKIDIIRQIVEKLNVRNKNEIFNAVIRREKLRTTNIGGNTALPHARTKFVKDIIVKLAIFRDGIDFDLSGKKDVNFVFLVLSPCSNTKGYLATISHILVAISKERVKEALLKTATKRQALSILNNVN